MTKLRVGHVGWLFRDESDDWTTVAWCDINEQRLTAQLAGHEGITPYTDHVKMAERDDLDAVVISSPNAVHARQAIDFLNAGKHVFLEKPMGITPDECDQLLLAARAGGKNLTIDFEMRVSRYARRLREILDSGEVGDLRRIEFIHHRGCWLEEDAGIWRTRPEKSGGLYLMEPIHEVDIFRFLAGEIRFVQSVAGPNTLPQYQFQDNVCTHFFFDSGVLGTLLTSHTHSAWTDRDADWPALGHDMRMILTCTRGSIGVDCIGCRILVNRFDEYPAGSGCVRVVFDRAEDYSAAGGHAFHHDITGMRREFLRRCAAGEPPLQDPGDAWRTHRACFAAEQSLREDMRRVEVDYASPGE